MATIRVLNLLSFLCLACLTFAVSSSSPASIAKRDSDIVQFTIELTWDDASANGGPTRKAILTNGTIPGPALMLREGQTVEFTVRNYLPFGTSVHFHGIGQLNTPWSDGTTGLSQWPIPSGDSYLYKWTANEAGTYFYHAHNKGQMMDGLYGAIVIEAANTTARPFSAISSDANDIEQMTQAELGNQPVFISDYTQYTFEEFYSIQEAADIDYACADSILVNGKGSVYCESRSDINAWTAPQIKPLLQTVTPSQMTDKGCLPPNLVAVQGNYTFNLTALPDDAYFTCTPSTGETTEVNVNSANGWAALTFINAAGFSILKFTIDNHKMWVYAVSGDYVKPQLVDQIVVGNGDRYSVMIKLDQPVGTYKINVANDGLNQIISGYASLVYDNSTTPATGETAVMNYAGINTTTITLFDDVLASPYNAIAPAADADVTFLFDIKKLMRAYTWTLSGTQGYNMSRDDQYPLLFQDPNNVPSSDLVMKTTMGQWVDLIIKVDGPLAQPHPMHKHANKAFVLGTGTGPFNYSTVAEAAAAMPAGTFNLENPPYRDTYTTDPAEGTSAWMALRYQVTNPGVWYLHCHIQTHLSGGMAIVLMDAVDEIPSIPAEYRDGNGFPQGSPDYRSITGSMDNSTSDDYPLVSSPDGTISATSSNASSSVAPFKGVASTQSLSISMLVIAALIVLFTFSL